MMLDGQGSSSNCFICMGTGIGSASDTYSVCPKHATMMQSMLPQTNEKSPTHHEFPKPKSRHQALPGFVPVCTNSGPNYGQPFTSTGYSQPQPVHNKPNPLNDPLAVGPPPMKMTMEPFYHRQQERMSHMSRQRWLNCSCRQLQPESQYSEIKPCAILGCRNPANVSGMCTTCEIDQNPPPRPPKPVPRQRKPPDPSFDPQSLEVSTAQVGGNLVSQLSRMTLEGQGSSSNCFICMGTGFGSVSDTYSMCPRHVTMMQSMLPQTNEKSPTHHEFPKPKPRHPVSTGFVPVCTNSGPNYGQPLTSTGQLQYQLQYYETPVQARDPSSQQAEKCLNCQTFHGSREYGGLCSKCFMKKTKTASGGVGTQGTKFDEQPAGGYGQTAGGYGQTAGAGGYRQTAGASGYGQTAGASGYGQTAGAGGYGQTAGAGGYGQTAGAGGYRQTAGADGYRQTAGASGYGQTVGAGGYQPTASDYGQNVNTKPIQHQSHSPGVGATASPMPGTVGARSSGGAMGGAIGGVGTQGTKFDEQPPVKMLCKVAGCSFIAVPELDNYCPDCYDEYYVPAYKSDQHPPQQPPRCTIMGCRNPANVSGMCTTCEIYQNPPLRLPKPVPCQPTPPLIGGSDTSIQETNCLQEELRVLNETVTQKENQVSLLRKENTELMDQIKQQQSTTQRYQEEKVQLQQDKEQLQQQKEQLQQEKVQLQQEKEQIQQEKEQQLRRQTASNRQLQKRLDEELVRNSQVVDFWKVPPQEVHVFKGEENILGRGAWGYVAKGRFRGQRVAVKCLHQAILDPRNVERVHREIRTMAQVRHPNLVLFIAAVYKEGRAPMIVTELLDTNLRQAYQRVHMTPLNKLSIFRDVSCALNYLHCHREPIIHRDVSAPNVLLEALANDTWKARVSDFGSANLAALSHTLGEGAIIYSAPETIPQPYNPHVLPLPQTPKIDVYSFGILLCEVTAGQFPDPERYSTLLREVQQAWPSMYSLIISCTKYHPNERPSMAQVLDELDRMPQP